MSDPLVSLNRLRIEKESRFNPLRQLNPARLTTILDEFENGNLRDFALLADVIANRDDVLSAVISKRIGAVSRRGIRVLKVPGVKEAQRADAEQHATALSYFYNNLTTRDAMNRDQRGGQGLLLRQMLRGALMVGHSVHEIQWKPGVNGLTASLSFIPLCFFENRTGTLRFLKESYAQAGVELEPNRFLISSGPSLMTASAVAFMFKRMSLQDWVDFNERFGTPCPVGKTDASPDSPEWKALVESVRSIGRDWAAVMSRSSEITALNFGSGASDSNRKIPFSTLLDSMNRSLARIWRGGDLSTMSQGEGAGTGASLQGDEALILEMDDASIVTEALNEHLDRFVIEYTFGEGVVPLAYAQVVVPDKQDVAQDRLVDEFLVRNGVRLSVQSTLDRYSRKQAADDATVLGEVANESQRAATQEPGLISNSRALLASAIAADLAPVRRRLQAMIDAEDPAAIQSLGSSFIAEFERLQSSILADPEASLALAKINSAGVLSGLTEPTGKSKTSNQNPDQKTPSPNIPLCPTTYSHAFSRPAETSVAPPY